MLLSDGKNNPIEKLELDLKKLLPGNESRHNKTQKWRKRYLLEKVVKQQMAVKYPAGLTVSQVPNQLEIIKSFVQSFIVQKSPSCRVKSLPLPNQPHFTILHTNIISGAEAVNKVASHPKQEQTPQDAEGRFCCGRGSSSYLWIRRPSGGRRELRQQV